jgi:ABC-2 type transport system ATP-binding protein
LDEPTASLDPEVARFVRDFILKRRDESQISIIFTSHNMSEVEEVCDRILFINNGKIVADDTPENLTKTIEICKVQLIIDKKNEAPLIELSHQNGWKHAHNEREHVIELKEKEISKLLSGMSEKGIPFHEISIDKPDLEDYFLMVARDNQNRDM